MFFKKKSKPEEALTSEQKEIYKDLSGTIDHKLANAMRNMMVGGSLAEIALAVAVDLTLTGGVGTAFLAVTGVLSGGMAAGAIWIHRDEKRNLMQRAIDLSEWKQRNKALEPPPAVVEPPKIPALLKLFSKTNAKKTGPDASSETHHLPPPPPPEG